MHCGKDEETEGKSAKNALLHRTSGSCEMRTHLHSFSHSGSEARKNSPIGGKSCGKPNAMNHPQVRQKWVVTPPVNIRCGKSITVFHIFLYVYPRRPRQKIGVVLAMAHGPWPSAKSPSPPRAPSMANLLGALGDLRSDGEAYCPS